MNINTAIDTHVFVHGCSSRFRCVRLFATLWTVARTTPLSMGFSRQEYWSGFPFPPPGDLLDRIEPVAFMSPALAGGVFFFLPIEPPGKLIHVFIFPPNPFHPGCHITVSRVTCTIW